MAGGKALNVARVLRRLGEPVRVVGTLGGMPEAFIRAWCDREGVDARWIRIEGHSRTCVIVVDPNSSHQTVLNEPGPTLTATDLQQVTATLDEATAAGDTLCISGSLPLGVPDTFYADLVHRMRKRDVRVLVDASGEPLRLALEAHPWAAAPNAAECAGALSLPDDPPRLLAALSRQTEHALLTLGSEGLLYADHAAAWHCFPPVVQAVNAVGSGDACVAGFLSGMGRGFSTHDAIRLGVACGAANAARFEPGIDSPAQVQQLSTETRIRPLNPVP